MVQERDENQIHGLANSSRERLLLELHMPPNTQEVLCARHRAIDVCLHAGFSEDDCACLDLALGEALANAVVHGAASEQRKQPADDVQVSMWDYKSQIIVEVRDAGCDFEPPLPPYLMPSPELNATHGRGLPLMEILTDALMICRGDADEGGSSTFLIKTKTNL